MGGLWRTPVAGVFAALALSLAGCGQREAGPHTRRPEPPSAAPPAPPALPAPAPAAAPSAATDAADPSQPRPTQDADVVPKSMDDVVARAIHHADPLAAPLVAAMRAYEARLRTLEDLRDDGSDGDAIVEAELAANAAEEVVFQARARCRRALVEQATVDSSDPRLDAVADLLRKCRELEDRVADIEREMAEAHAVEVARRALAERREIASMLQGLAQTEAHRRASDPIREAFDPEYAAAYRRYCEIEWAIHRLPREDRAGREQRGAEWTEAVAAYKSIRDRLKAERPDAYAAMLSEVRGVRAPEVPKSPELLAIEREAAELNPRAERAAVRRQELATLHHTLRNELLGLAQERDLLLPAAEAALLDALANRR